MRRALFAPAFLLLAACNTVTGMDNVLFIGGSGAAGGAGDAGTGGQGTGNQGGSGNEGGAPPSTVEATGVSITDVVLYQGVERPLVSGGAQASSGTPVVAGRDALIRVFTATDGSYDGGVVTARLSIDGGAPLEVQRSIGGASTESNLGTTFNFDVPGSSLQVGSQFSIELVQPFEFSKPTTWPGARYPETGDAPLQVETNGGTLKVTIVPVRYQADGSNRLPDTSANALALYEAGFMALYPIAAVDLQVRAQFNWGSAISPNGAGWGELLDAITNLRFQDGAAFEEYYFGAFKPASSFGGFCSGGCVAGLGSVGGPADEWARASIGLGYGDEDSVFTTLHEVGHNHGRNHSPCGGAQGVDPGYPYSGASIGSWGYDLASQSLLSPASYTDIMGYCQPQWISDYTFSAIFDHIKAVNGASLVFPADVVDKEWERALVRPDGTASWVGVRKLHRPPLGQAVAATVVRAGVTETITARWYPLDHLPGGTLLWRAGKQKPTTITVDLGQGPTTYAL